MNIEKANIRKVVGNAARHKRVLERVYELRERMFSLGIDLGNDDERIRKIVHQPKKGRS